jgi:hypothetical protein
LKGERTAGGAYSDLSVKYVLAIEEVSLGSSSCLAVRTYHILRVVWGSSGCGGKIDGGVVVQERRAGNLMYFNVDH